MENTIFFGNGLNCLSPTNISWPVLLDTIKGARKFKNDKLPYTMVYERIILERPDDSGNVLFDEFEVKQEIARLLENTEPNDIYRDLFYLDAQNYITTNYDYGFVDSMLELPEVNLPIHEYSTEDVYSIRRLKRISNTKEKIKHFWQVHGEIRKPATIMLGLDHYCGSIGKINDYIKGKYEYQVNGETIKELSIGEKFEQNAFTNSSWVELFFTSNIHIIGFSLDFSEIDLWWIINKRARMKKSEALRSKIKNRIIYHCHSIDLEKKELLKSMNIDVHQSDLPETDTPYFDYFKVLMAHLKRVLK